MAKKRVEKAAFEADVRALEFVEGEGADNIATAVDGDHLYLRVDLTKDFGPSKSGRTHIIASSRGWINDDAAKVGISFNVVTKNGRK